MVGTHSTMGNCNEIYPWKLTLHSNVMCMWMYYKNSTLVLDIIGHVENSNFIVENTSVFYVFKTFTSRPNLDVKKRRIF